LRPIAAVTALIFGSSAAISFGLTATAIVFLFLQGEQPSLARELPILLRGCAGFWAMSAVSGACLYATLKELRWQVGGQVAMWLAVVAIGYAYWPK
jgi:hypothetical protein